MNDQKENKSETPRTDEYCLNRLDGMGLPQELVSADFARSMEREIKALIAERNSLLDRISVLQTYKDELVSAKRVFELMKKYPFLLTDGNDLDRQELEAAQDIDDLLSAESKVGE